MTDSQPPGCCVVMHTWPTAAGCLAVAHVAFLRLMDADQRLFSCGRASSDLNMDTMSFFTSHRFVYTLLWKSWHLQILAWEKFTVFIYP